MKISAGKQVYDMLESAGGLKSLARQDVVTILGNGAPSKNLERIGYEEIMGLVVS